MAITREVNDLLVNFRNPVHAIVANWMDWSFAVQSALVLFALFIVRKERLFPIFGILVLGTTLLTVFQVISNNHTLALIYPWRTSVIMVPISTTILLAFCITQISNFWKADPVKMELWLRFPCMIILTLFIFVGVARFQIDVSRQVAAPALPVMTYVAEHKSANDVYLVPVKMEDFRLVTGAPIFVDFQSIPYRDVDVLEWDQRFRQANYFYQNADCSSLPALYERGITHVVLPVDFPVQCPALMKLYQDDSYGLFSLGPE